MGDSDARTDPDAVASPAQAVGAAQTSPVAVVWCRQVDNEAESPGYTTIPETFPGHAETLDAIRLVGNLTVNVADTHDYWDPDPTQPLSYYPNLFLFPASGGRYTCVGRMFLSTEDRPRLGMKTLVLDTARLLSSGEYGPTILKWHASMGGARPPGTKPPIPDSKLYGLLGEGFLFHRGATDPVLLIAGDDWDGAMHVILEMVRVLPASLVALGAILAFPYFLPQPKTNLHEFIEQLPLSLALMRVPRREAVGERHAQRIAAWEHTSLTVRDLTQDEAGTGGSRTKESLPLVLQYVRDQNLTKLEPVVQRVDLVEGERRRSQLFDSDHQGGKDRRKEMWRVGTAMESAALLLSRSRGRHVPVNVETARRAQQYLQARVPQADQEELDAEPLAATVQDGDGRGSGQVPPWLQRGESPSAMRTDRVEVVPMSRSDDPSLLPPAPRDTAPPAALLAGEGARDALTPPSPSPPPIDVTQLRADIERDLLRYIEQRWATSGPPGTPTPTTDERFQEFDRRMNERLAAAMDQAVARATAERGRGDATAAGLEALKRTFDQKLSDLSTAQTQATAALGNELAHRIDDSGNRARLNTLQDIAAAETRLRDVIGKEMTQEVDRRTALLVDARVQELSRRLQQAPRPPPEDVGPRIQEQVDRLGGELRLQVDAKEEELRHALAAQLDLHLREAAEREDALKASVSGMVPGLLDPRLREQEARVQKSVRESEQRLGAASEGRLRDLQDRWTQRVKEVQDQVTELLATKLAEQDGKVSNMTEARMEEVGEANRHAIADLQVRMEAHFDQQLGEALDAERGKYLELLARLKGDIDQAWGRAYDSPRFDQAVRDRVSRAFETFQADTQKLMDTRLTAAEARIRADQSSAVHRLEEVEKTLEARGKELFRVEDGIRADLEELDSRLQTLSDRLVPIVQKTWLRIGELEKTRSPAEETAAKLEVLRRDFAREVRRVQQELVDRTTDIRERMETTLANQGKVWLAVIRQMSHNAVERSPAASRSVARGRASDDQFALDSLPPDEEEFDRFTGFSEPGGDREERPTGDAARAARRRRPAEPNRGA